MKRGFYDIFEIRVNGMHFSGIIDLLVYERKTNKVFCKIEVNSDYDGSLFFSVYFRGPTGRWRKHLEINKYKYDHDTGDMKNEVFEIIMQKYEEQND